MRELQLSLSCFKIVKRICRRQISSRFWTESVLPECREVQLLRFSEGKWRREPTSKSCNLPKASTRSCHPAPEGRKHINTSQTNLSDKGTLPQHSQETRECQGHQCARFLSYTLIHPIQVLYEKIIAKINSAIAAMRSK